ncbi:phage tail spike protein [Oceanobacillus profundus]|uniref:phage tail spike protein n=1 Tax=Oceanobacillus TaxID=182709 RepID=UPI0026E213BC|nr:phage tail spike protein [Oceanobacillus profundus]MDO6448081.1 phage tail spike protein [Oceanobacillus profundus]
MYPVLYKSDETDFVHNGLGLLTGTVTAVAIEELNGMFELNMQYDNDGFLADVIDEEMIIKAKANDKQDEQLFRIYSITKNHENDNLIIDAVHITNDLANNFVEKLEARNLTKRQVMELIGSSTAYPHAFNVTSSNSTTQSSTSLYRTNPLQMIAGMDGSVLQFWGGQIERDNFNLVMHDRRGSDDGVLVTYKKNLTGLTAKFDISNLVTRIYPFIFKEATDDEPEELITVPGKYIDSPHINDYEMPYILPVDFSNEEGVETSQDLLAVASNWFKETGRDKPKVEMEVQFEHLWETEEYKDVAALELVGMGDTITVKHSKLSVEGAAIVNRIEYDVIVEKNLAVDVGNVKAKFTDKVNKASDVVNKVTEIEQNANQAITAANGKNRIYYGPDEPSGNLNEGDLWFRVVDGEYTRTYRYDGIQWKRVVSADVKDIENIANDARNQADQAVANANLATSNALEAISEAQGAFDEAQSAMTRADSAFNKADALSTIVDDQTGEISSIKQIAQGLQTRVSSAEGNISTLQQTSSSFATRIENAEGNISSLTQTAQGLQNRVASAEGDISSVTQLANTLQTDLRDAEGNINTLTQTASSLDSTIKSVRDDLDGLEIGGRNIVSNNSLTMSLATKNGYVYRLTKTGASNPYLRVSKNYFEPDSNYVATFKVKKISGTVNGMAGHNVSFGAGNGDIYRDRVKVYSDRSWSSGDQDYPDDTNTHSYEVHFKTPKSFPADSAPYWYIQPNRPNYGPNYVIEIWDFQIEKGTKATDWSPAPEDLATQSQFTQLSDNINLRVMKDDIINQINVSTESILISGKKLILDGDTTVRGTFRVDSANITSVDASKMTTGILDAGRVSVINLSANSITGGILQSQNSNTTFNLNNGSLSMNNTNFTLGGGADIHFTSAGNRMYFQRFDGVGGITRSAGFGVGTSINDRFPYVFLGTTNTTKPNPRDEENFTGFIANTRQRQQTDGIGNSVVGHIFHIRDEAVSFNKGLMFDLTSNEIDIHPMNTSTYAYNLGTNSGGFRRLYLDGSAVVYAVDRINYRNKFDLNQGWAMQTSYEGNPQMAFYGLNASDWFTNPKYYNLGSNSNRFSYLYTVYQPDVRSDERMKENIRDNDLGLAFIKDIETKSFQLINKNPNLAVEPIQYGIIAQQLRDTLINHGVDIESTNILSRSADGYYGVQYSQLIPPTIKGLQELDLKVDEGFTRLQSVIDDEISRVRKEKEELVLKVAKLEERIHKLEVAA